MIGARSVNISFRTAFAIVSQLKNTSIFTIKCRSWISKNALSHVQLKGLCRQYHNMTAEERYEMYRSSALRRQGLESRSDEVSSNLLWPPEHVRGMKELDMAAFKKTVSVPCARVASRHFRIFMPVLKPYLLKITSLAPVNDSVDHKIVNLNPYLFNAEENSLMEKVKSICARMNLETCHVINFTEEDLELSYENWSAKDIFRAVLPLEHEAVGAYSIVGHIVHLNLREHLLPFKKLIGQVLLNKVKNAQVVVNKVDDIETYDNTFRCFNMEVLAGEKDTIVSIKENGCSFCFDFAKVYWNTRLSTEHSIIIGKLKNNDVLYDIMAGVGPFSVGAAVQKHCHVLANDLNPESYRWLVSNVTKNNVQQLVQCYNMDGGEFIKKVVKNDIIIKWQDEFAHSDRNIHITMNLPSLAETFLVNFVGLMTDVPKDFEIIEPTVHVYMFAKDLRASSCVKRVAYYLGLLDDLPNFDGDVTAALQTLHETGDENVKSCVKALQKKKFLDEPEEIPGLEVIEVQIVRKVSTYKAMVRVSFKLSKHILWNPKGSSLTRNFGNNHNELEKPSKRLKADTA